jgi:chemotaxis protein MotB
MSSGGGLLEEEHEEHENHEAWVIPYADMLTLLMALFMMLFAISSVDLAKFEALAGSLSSALGDGQRSVLEGGSGILDGSSPAAVDLPPVQVVRRELPPAAAAALAREAARAAQQAAEHRVLDELEQLVRERAAAAGVSGSLELRQEARGLVVTVVTDQVLFAPGQAAVQEGGVTILATIAAAVRDLPHRISVEGHTDDRPIGTARYRSNWELSTARATEVVRYLVDEAGIAPARIAAAGYGDTRPVASNDSAEGRALNRRVEVVVLADVVD